MAKKYRLLKDLPNVKAGAAVEWNNTQTWVGGPYVGGRYGIWPMPSEGSCDLLFTPDDVENNPEWFEEVVEKEFVWDGRKLDIQNAISLLVEEKYCISSPDGKYYAPAGAGTANDVLNTEEKKKAIKSWIDFMPEGIDPREVTANDVLNTEDEMKFKTEQTYKGGKWVSTDYEISGGGIGGGGGSGTGMKAMGGGGFIGFGEVGKIIRIEDVGKAFNAAREEIQNPSKTNPYWTKKYRTFQDYIEGKPTTLKDEIKE